MVNYQNGKIYKIVSNVTDDVYIGSTCEKLSQRLAKHRANYKLYLNGKCNYVTSIKIIETGDYDIILIENYPCETKEELHARERFHIENNNCVNKCIPGRKPKESKIEYYNNNKEYFKEYRKEYYNENMEQIKLKNSEKITCEICGKTYTRNHKLRHQRSKFCLEIANKIST